MEDLIPNCEPAMEACEALIIGLGSRRFVIIRHDETGRLHPIARSSIRDLRVGDAVIYQGGEETVHAIDVYR